MHPTSKQITYPEIEYDEDGNVQLNHIDTTDQFAMEIDEHLNDGQITQPQDNKQNRVQKFIANIPKRLSKPPLVSSTSEWRKLQRHAQHIKSLHLRDLLQDPERCDAMWAEHDGVYYDYSRQQATLETMDLLFDLAEKQDLVKRIHAMVNGEKINFTEDRAVLHTALRASKDDIGTVFVDDVDAIKEVHEVLDQIKEFTEAFRSGKITGYTGKRMRNIVSVGIGGSYLGPEFLAEVLKTEEEGINSSLGYSLRFLANVDPVDVERTCADLDPEETLIIIVSKTFTTAETMLNARTMRQWLWDFMGDDIEVVRKHVVACSSVSATENVKKFGVDTENYFFRFWDWVGGRYSVCGAAGAVPISLLYGYDLFEKFLEVSILYFFAVIVSSVYKLIVLRHFSGGSIDGPAFYKCTYARKHTNHNGATGGMELIVYGLQLTCFDSLCPSTIEVACTHSTIGHGGEMLVFDGSMVFCAAANTNLRQIIFMLVEWKENKSTWHRN
jgi:hypothetical protein